MRRALVMLVLATLAACGGDDGREVERGTATPRAERSQPPTRAEIEEFGRIRLPASARDVQARMSSALDTGLFLRFVMDRAEVDAFVRDGGFDARAGYRPSYSYAEDGWHLDRIRNTLGARELDGSFGRELVIDLDTPSRATVYLVATTV